MSHIKTKAKRRRKSKSVDLGDTGTRRRYEKAYAFFGKKLLPLANDATASERLTKDDFAIRINAR
jgi:hypothetical protein